jgi:ATP-binding cassette subfamily C exporter for protease/lipase
MFNFLKAPEAKNEILVSLYKFKSTFRSVAVFTAVMNMLLLVPSFYMLEVYDRVLSSRNEYTLMMLTVFLLFLNLLYAGLDTIRSHTVIAIGKKIDSELNQRTYTAAFEQNLKQKGGNAGQALNDLTTLRQFITGPALYAFFDAPWFPIYLIVIFIFNFWLGVFSTVCVLIVLIVAVINESITSQPLSKANGLAVVSSNMATNNLRNSDVLETMGMLPGIRRRWYELHSRFLVLQEVASQRASNMTSLTKFLRTSMQSLALGFAAFLVIENLLSPGMMIAASVLLGKALGPVEAVIAVWRQWGGVKSAYDRLDKLLAENPPRTIGMSLPKPKGYVELEGVYAAPPGISKPVLKNVAFKLEPGDVLGVIGASASGKSTLAKVMVGLWPGSPNCARLDGADVYRWNKDELGPSIGYVPQDIDMFPGTVSENIARFNEFTPEDVIEAAQTAGVHDMILRFPQGYDTKLGESTFGLSGGQKQRIALARALYGKPSLIVLDEPNSNLDDIGEDSLIVAIQKLKERKATVVLVTHRVSILQVTTKLLLLDDGIMKAFGPTQKIMQDIQDAHKKQVNHKQGPVTIENNGGQVV